MAGSLGRRFRPLEADFSWFTLVVIGKLLAISLLAAFACLLLYAGLEVYSFDNQSVADHGYTIIYNYF